MWGYGDSFPQRIGQSRMTSYNEAGQGGRKMITQPLASRLKTHWISIGTIILVLIYVAINIFHLGGDTFVISLNDNISNPVALAVSILAVTLCFRLGVRGRNRLLWSGLAVGWILATIAEFWWGIAALVEQEVPYPSWADLFWVASYIPMIAALLVRSLSLPRRTSWMQITGTVLSILVSLGSTIVFVLIPIIQTNKPQAFLENLLNVLYPLLDLGVFIVVLSLLFAYQEGMYGRAWLWLSAGFAIQSIANLLFSYASTINQYYPHEQLNLLSTVGIDIPYNLSYLLWLIGLVKVLEVQNSHRIFTDSDTYLPIQPISNTHILVYTTLDGTVTGVSRNYKVAFSMDPMEGKTVAETLGASPDGIDRLMGEIRAGKMVGEKPILVKSLWGEQPAWISGTITTDSKGNFSGTNLLLRMFTKDYDLDELLTDQQKVIMVSISGQTGSIQEENEEIKQFLSNYYLAFLKSLYNRVFTEGGSLMADAFLAELHSVASHHNWRIGVRPDTILDLRYANLPTVRQALPILFEAAKAFVSNIADETTSYRVVQNVSEHFDEAIHKSAVHFEKLQI
jgi:hypothetical protein